MNNFLTESVKLVITALIVVIFADVLGVFYDIGRENNYQEQVEQYIQTAGGVTPEVMEKADKLSKENYGGHFKLLPHGSGPKTNYKGKNYEGVYPTQWSTDHDDTPIYQVLTERKVGKISNVTDKGCLMSLLDHPGKLFAGDLKDFKDVDRYIPSDIPADKVKEIKPIGYIDKNYFVTSSSLMSMSLWCYRLEKPKELKNPDAIGTYIYDMDKYKPDGSKETRKRDYSLLKVLKIDADDPKVHFNDKSLKGKQEVAIACSSNTITGNAYPNRWSDLKANSYPHDYGSQINYDIQISVPFLKYTEGVSGLQNFGYKTTKYLYTTSMYRDTKY